MTLFISEKINNELSIKPFRISEYNPPTPAKGSGVHRYQFLMYAQRYPYGELTVQADRFDSNLNKLKPSTFSRNI